MSVPKLPPKLNLLRSVYYSIFIDISIRLEHQSQIGKVVFLGYHLTVESNVT
jgi:hypothetical protein